jgi:hypothetical protein
MFWVFFSQLVGRYLFFGGAHKNCFGKQTPKKGLFSSINRRFWD